MCIDYLWTRGVTFSLSLYCDIFSVTLHRACIPSEDVGMLRGAPLVTTVLRGSLIQGGSGERICEEPRTYVALSGVADDGNDAFSSIGRAGRNL